MGSKFEAILKCVKGRKRFLNAANGVWQLLTASLILTAAYLIIEVAALPPSFKLLPKCGLSLLILFNFVVGAVGFVIGYLQRIDLAAALYQADRKLKLGEKLCTIYDLRAQAPTSDFLPMLYQKIAPLEIDIKKIFPFSRAQKIKFTSLAVLVLFWAVLALQYTERIDFNFIGLQGEQVSAPKKEGEEKAPVESEDILMEQLAEIRGSVEALERLQRQAARSEARNEALGKAAQLLSQRLDSLRQSLLGQESSASEPSTAAGDREKQRQQIEQLKKDLQKLNEKLAQGASSDEIGELLKSIAQNMSSESFEKLSEAAQAYDQDRLEELSEKISNELEAQEKLDKQIQELQERLKELVTSLEKQKEQMASKEQGEPSEGPSDTKADADKSGHPEEGEAPKHEAEETGQETNTQGGKSGSPMPKQPSQTPPDFYKAPISGLLPSAPTSTKELPTKKAPIETEVTAQGIVYRVNYQKLEATLKEMQDELPPEMREIIRAYFQLITQQEHF